MRLIVGLMLLSGTLTAQAALLGRAPLNPPSGPDDDPDPVPESEFQAWYDTRLNVTWLDDANYPQTADIPLPANGSRMTWFEAQDWLAALNATSHLGASDWRLPNALPVDEMQDLYSATLGNHGVFDAVDPCLASPCFTNDGPFENLLASDYWTGTLQFNGEWAADFYWGGGYAGNGAVATGRKYVWAVRDGDIAVIPVPAAAWLFGSGLGLLCWLRRRPID